MFRYVHFTENLISTSFEGSLFAQHFGVFDSKVKYENAGKRRRDGCLRKFLKRPRCQVEMTPKIRPCKNRQNNESIKTNKTVGGWGVKAKNI